MSTFLLPKILLEGSLTVDGLLQLIVDHELIFVDVLLDSFNFFECWIVLIVHIAGHELHSVETFFNLTQIHSNLNNY